MRPQVIESRMESLERRVTRLEQLPGRIDDLTSQISQLRSEMRGDFSAVRNEVAERTGALETKIDDLGTQMRVLHEDVISRIARLHEGRPARPKRKSPKR